MTFSLALLVEAVVQSPIGFSVTINLSGCGFFIRSDYSHAAPFKMYSVGFRAFKSPVY